MRFFKPLMAILIAYVSWESLYATHVDGASRGLVLLTLTLTLASARDVVVCLSEACSGGRDERMVS